MYTVYASAFRCVYTSKVVYLCFLSHCFLCLYKQEGAAQEERGTLN